jgi:hypothetical protein
MRIAEEGAYGSPIRRNVLATGAAATAMAAASRVFAQQAGQGGAATLVIRGGIVHSVDNPRGEARDIGSKAIPSRTSWRQGR